MNSTTVNDIRGVLIQIAGSQLLLPNAATVEVLSYVDPEPLDNAPDWLLGQIRWRGWRLPLVSFARIAGTHSEGAAVGTKVIVIKALGGDPRLINPLIPAELVIDHSVQVDSFARADSLDLNAKIEFDRNKERYGFLRWGQNALNRVNSHHL